MTASPLDTKASQAAGHVQAFFSELESNLDAKVKPVYCIGPYDIVFQRTPSFALHMAVNTENYAWPQLNFACKIGPMHDWPGFLLLRKHRIGSRIFVGVVKAVYYSPFEIIYLMISNRC